MLLFVGVEVETKVGIASPFQRTFWSEPAQFTHVDLTEHVADEDQCAIAFGAGRQPYEQLGLRGNGLAGLEPASGRVGPPPPLVGNAKSGQGRA